jgi:hypothetical protein
MKNFTNFSISNILSGDFKTERIEVSGKNSNKTFFLTQRESYKEFANNDFTYSINKSDIITFVIIYCC